MRNHSMKKIFTSLIWTIFSSTLVCGTSNYHDLKTHYCNRFDSGEKSKIIKNKKIGTADTAIAFVSGHFIDYNKQPISAAIIMLRTGDSTNKYGRVTDSSGSFKISVPAGNYTLIASYVGYNSIGIKNFKLGQGEMREVIIKLGRASSFICE